MQVNKRKKLTVVRLKGSGYACRYQRAPFFLNKKSFWSRGFAAILLLLMLFSSIQFFGFVKITKAATVVWDGGGGDANWTTGANWSTNSVPTPADIAQFDSTFLSNCSATINTSTSISGLNLAAGYANVVTQSNGFTLAIGSSNFAVASGTFVGGNSNITVTDGSFTQTGGTVTSTSATLSVERNFTLTAGTFNHNSGTVLFADNASTDDSTVTCGASTFNLVTITKDNSGDMVISSGCTVPLGASPTTALGGTSTNSGTMTISSGTWNVTQRVNLTNNGTITHSGTGWISTGGLVMGSSAVVSYPSGTTTSFGLNLNVASGTFPSGLTTTFTDISTGDDTTLTCGSVTFTKIIITKDSGGAMVISSGCTVPLGASPTSAFNGPRTFTNNGTTTIDSGTWTISSAPNFTNNGTITHNGSGWVAGGNFTNGSSGVVTYAGSTMSLIGNLNIASGTFPSGLTITFTASGGTDSTLTCGSVTFTQVIITKDHGDMTISAGCTVPLGASPTTTFAASGSNTTFTNNGTTTIDSGIWTITDTSTSGFNLLTNNGTIIHNGSGWVTGGGFTNGSAGVVTYAGSTMTVNGTFNVASGTFPSGLTLTLGDDPQAGSGADHSTLTCGSVTFTKVIITKNSGGGSTPGGSLTINAGCTIPLGASPTSVSNNPATWVNNGTITVDSGIWTHTDTNTSNSGGNKLTNNGTITHNGSGWDWGNGLANGSSGVVTYATGTTASFAGPLDVSQGTFPSGKIITFTDNNAADDTTLTCGSVTFGGLTINKDASGPGDMILGSSCTDTGNLTFTAGTVSNPSSAYTLIVQGDAAFNSSGTFGGANLTLSLEGSATSTVSKTAGTFGSIFNVNKSSTNPAILSTTFAVATQTCTTVLGIFDINAQAFTCGSTFTIQNGATLKLVGSETPTTPTLNSGSTVFYKGDGDGLADSYSIKNYSYHHLTAGMTDSNDTLNATGVTPLTVPGNFTHSGGIFSAPATLNVAGNFTHSGGTFTHNSGTVILNGGDQTVSGNTTFNNLTKNATSSPRTLTLGASETQTIVGTMDLQGTSGNLLSLRSSTPGTQAQIDPQGTRTIGYLDVKDNYNINATIIDITGFNITDSGNNTGWGFPVAGGGAGPSGGGGGANPFPPPASGFKLIINNGDTLTTSSNVSLSLDGGEAATMAIANSPDLSNVTKIPYQTTLSWNICQNLSSCLSNTYTVYAIFYNQNNVASPMVSDSIQYLEPEVVSPEPSPEPTPTTTNPQIPLGIDLTASLDKQEWFKILSGVAINQPVNFKAFFSGDFSQGLTYNIDCTGNGGENQFYQSQSTALTLFNVCSYPKKGIYTATLKAVQGSSSKTDSVIIEVDVPASKPAQANESENPPPQEQQAPPETGGEETPQDGVGALPSYSPPASSGGSQTENKTFPVFAQFSSGFKAVLDSIVSAVTNAATEIAEGVSNLVNGGTGAIGNGLNNLAETSKKSALALKKAFSLVSENATSVKIAAGASTVVVAPTLLTMQYSLAAHGLIFQIKSFTDLWLMLISLLQGFLTSIGLRRVRKRWGTVYDSVTKQPLDPAIVELVEVKSGKVIEKSITDLTGRFGFLIKPGQYILRAKKSHYVFPSKLIALKTDGIFNNLYHGEVLKILDTNDVLSPNIPMDQTDFDWNQQEKQKIVKFHPKLEIFITKLLGFLFWLGLIFVVLTFFAHPTVLNGIFIIIYFLLTILRKLIPHLKLWGKVSSSEVSTKELLLELSPKNLPQITLGKALTNKDGRFFLKAPPGQYILRIRQTTGPTMQVLKETEVTIGKEGVLNKEISLE